MIYARLANQITSSAITTTTKLKVVRVFCLIMNAEVRETFSQQKRTVRKHAKGRRPVSYLNASNTHLCNVASRNYLPKLLSISNYLNVFHEIAK